MLHRSRLKEKAQLEKWYNEEGKEAVKAKILPILKKYDVKKALTKCDYSGTFSF
jgi:hypothetical protein